MFISYYTIIYFFVKNFFFECLYFSEYDIRMFLFVFWLGNRPSIKYLLYIKYVTMGIVEICICVMLFNTNVQFFGTTLPQKQLQKCGHMFTRERGGIGHKIGTY